MPICVYFCYVFPPNLYLLLAWFELCSKTWMMFARVIWLNGASWWRSKMEGISRMTGDQPPCIFSYDSVLHVFWLVIHVGSISDAAHLGDSGVSSTSIPPHGRLAVGNVPTSCFSLLYFCSFGLRHVCPGNPPPTLLSHILEMTAYMRGTHAPISSGLVDFADFSSHKVRIVILHAQFVFIVLVHWQPPLLKKYFEHNPHTHTSKRAFLLPLVFVDKSGPHEKPDKVAHTLTFGVWGPDRRGVDLRIYPGQHV